MPHSNTQYKKDISHYHTVKGQHMTIFSLQILTLRISVLRSIYLTIWLQIFNKLTGHKSRTHYLIIYYLTHKTKTNNYIKLNVTGVTNLKKKITFNKP